MRGCADDRLPHWEKGFYTWVGGHLGRQYALAGIRERFETGEYELLSGTIPEDHIGYVAFAGAVSC